MSGWRFPFKYKLSLCIAVIVFGLLGGAFLLIQNLIERNVAVEIERDLAGARQLVARLIEERRLHLGELAQVQAPLLDQAADQLPRAGEIPLDLGRDIAFDQILNQQEGSAQHPENDHCNAQR